MKVFNLTDVLTEVLEQRGLVNQHIAVTNRMVSPGEFVEVEDTPVTRSAIESLVRFGALAVDQLPPPYLQKRQQMEATSGRIGSKVSAHIDLKETKTAGEPAPGPLPEGETVVAVRHDPTAAQPDEPTPPAPAEDPPPLQPPQSPKKKTGNR